jgi:hypothetical protein
MGRFRILIVVGAAALVSAWVVVRVHAALEFKGAACIPDTNCQNCLVDTQDAGTTPDENGDPQPDCPDSPDNLQCILVQGSSEEDTGKHCVEGDSSEGYCNPEELSSGGATCEGANIWYLACTDSDGTCTTYSPSEECSGTPQETADHEVSNTCT